MHAICCWTWGCPAPAMILGGSAAEIWISRTDAERNSFAERWRVRACERAILLPAAAASSSPAGCALRFRIGVRTSGARYEIPRRVKIGGKGGVLPALWESSAGIMTSFRIQSTGDSFIFLNTRVGLHKPKYYTLLKYFKLIISLEVNWRYFHMGIQCD